MRARRATGLTLSLTLALTLKSPASPAEFSIAVAYCFFTNAKTGKGKNMDCYSFTDSGGMKG